MLNFKKLKSKKKSVNIQVEVKACSSEKGHFKKQIGQLLLYLPPDSSALELKLGSKLLFYSGVSLIKPPRNPDAFDYAAYQAKRNVFHQARVESSHWFVHQESWTLKGEAMAWRQGLMNILRQYLDFGSNELAVAAALILGEKSELGDDLRNAYTDTGAVHVLAVSGLHVGFIAWGLAWILSVGPWDKILSKWTRLVISLLGVWAFALLTGLSPSVMRAACMFSFILAGQALSRQTSIYNIIAISAFLLLLIDPFLVFNLGFQLSYLAVLGIVYFQPHIYKQLYLSNWVLDYLWKLSSVSLAAQLATLPLSLFYFHQFPVYFLLSGIVVVTAASLILGLGILLFVTSFIPVVANLVAYLLYGVLWLNNAFVFALNELPGGLVSGVWIGGEVLLLLYLAVLFLARLMYNQRNENLMLLLMMMALVFSLNIRKHYYLSNQRKWIVYHQYKETIIDAFDGNVRYTYSSLDEEHPALDWSINPHREKMNVSLINSDCKHWFKRKAFIGFYHTTMLIIDASFKPSNARKKIIVDLVLLKNAPNVSLLELVESVQADFWIIDGSTPAVVVKRWKNEAENLGIIVHYTATDGAFVLEF